MRLRFNFVLVAAELVRRGHLFYMSLTQREPTVPGALSWSRSARLVAGIAVHRRRRADGSSEDALPQPLRGPADVETWPEEP